MKLKLSIGIAALFLVMQTNAFAITGHQVYNKYKQIETKMDKSFKSIKMVVEMDTAGTVTETTIYRKGKKTRVEAVIKKSNNPMLGQPGQKSIVIDDGVNMTTFHPMMGKMVMPSDSADEESRKPSKVKYYGEETVSGIKCHKIKARFLDGEQETLWIAVKDYALVKEKDGEGTKIVNSNFKKIKGFRLPYLTQTYDNGSLESTSKIKLAKVGVSISNSKFNPAKVKGFKAPKKGAGNQGSGLVPQNGEQGVQMMNMMGMAMEIQRLHMNGETEKAEALTRKMQQMGQQGQ